MANTVDVTDTGLQNIQDHTAVETLVGSLLANSNSSFDELRCNFKYIKECFMIFLTEDFCL
jgi:hypothetical protein